MAELPEGQRGGDCFDTILQIGRTLLKNFIIGWLQRHGGEDFNITHTQLGGMELCDPTIKEVGQCLQQIGDDLDRNMELQSMLDNSNLKLTKEVFIEVAYWIFCDKKCNWGRVVMLFYFTCRLVMKALKQNIPDIIQTIITWTIDYLRENVVNWIRQRGGWEDVWSYFGTPTWQMVGVFLTGVLTALLVVHKMG